MVQPAGFIACWMCRVNKNRLHGASEEMGKLEL